MEILDEGNQIRIGSRTFDLTGARPNIVIKPDGIAYLSSN